MLRSHLHVQTWQLLTILEGHNHYVYMDPVANPRGQFGATAPPNGCGASLIQMRPFMLPIEVETQAKIF